MKADIYIGVDPGRTTGLALYLPELSHELREAKSMGELVQWIKVVFMAYQGRSIVVGVEEFYDVTSFTNKYAKEVIELIGAVKAICLRDSQPLPIMVPPMLKARYSKAHMEKWPSPRSAHETDAIKIMLAAKDI